MDTETPEEPEFVLPDDFADQVKGWDVPIETLPEAVELYKTLQTEEGQIESFVRLGQNLGFGTKDLEKLFVDDDPTVDHTPPPPAVPETPPEPIDLDRPLTVREVQDLIKAEREAVEARFEGLTQAEQERQEQILQGKREVTFKAINEWFDTNEVSEDARVIIARLGEKTIPADADSYTPEVAVAALERGAAEYVNFLENEARALLEKKVAKGEALPTSISGGGSEGGEADETPDYRELGGAALQSAKDRVRAKLRAGGELQ